MIGGTTIRLAPGKFRINPVTIKESARIGDTVISLVIPTYRQHKNIGTKLDVLDYPELERYQAICRSLLADSVYEETLVGGREMTMETAKEST